MFRAFSVMLLLAFISSTAFAQAVNPARAYEQKRETETPADGVWYVYDRQGKLSKEEHYKTYRLDGEVKSFYTNGAIKAITPYVDGKRVGLEKTYFDNGSLQGENIYVANNLEGLSRQYNSEGNIEREAEYSKGQLDGITKVYYNNGSLKQILNYKNGIVNGSISNYNEEGKIITEDVYSNGILVAHKDYTNDAGSLVSSKNIPMKDDKAKKPSTPPAAAGADKKQ